MKTAYSPLEQLGALFVAASIVLDSMDPTNAAASHLFILTPQTIHDIFSRSYAIFVPIESVVDKVTIA